MSRKNRGQKTTLFLRILFRLTIPLIFLATVVTALQLMNEIKLMNRFYKVESKLIVESMIQSIGKALDNGSQLDKPELLRMKIRQTVTAEREIPIQIFDMVGDKTLLKDNHPWTSVDRSYADHCLAALEETGKPYLSKIDKENKQIISYIPHKVELSDRTYVSRVIYPLTNVETLVWDSRWNLLTLMALILLTGVLIVRSLATIIVQPVKELNNATQEIIAGNLDRKVSIRTGDEFETLAETFNHMSSSLRNMKSTAEDANPLSQLPGNNGIKQNIQRRIAERQKFVVFHTDLDRFKTFNDIYGLSKGDEAITRTANLIKNVVKEKGAADDFVGHQGGDDFMIIVKPNRAEAIADEIVKRFDLEVVKPVYPKEDYDRGYTLALDRRGMSESGAKEAQMREFPLLGLSLAGVSNKKNDFASYEDCLKRAVPVKKEVKAVVESSYVIRD